MKKSDQFSSIISLPLNFQENIILKEIELSKGIYNLNTVYELIELYIKGIQHYDYFNKNELSYYFSNKCHMLIAFAVSNNIFPEKSSKDQSIIKNNEDARKINNSADTTEKINSKEKQDKDKIKFINEATKRDSLSKNFFKSNTLFSQDFSVCYDVNNNLDYNNNNNNLNTRNSLASIYDNNIFNYNWELDRNINFEIMNDNAIRKKNNLNYDFFNVNFTIQNKYGKKIFCETQQILLYIIKENNFEINRENFKKANFSKHDNEFFEIISKIRKFKEEKTKILSENNFSVLTIKNLKNELKQVSISRQEINFSIINEETNEKLENKFKENILQISKAEDYMEILNTNKENYFEISCNKVKRFNEKELNISLSDNYFEIIYKRTKKFKNDDLKIVDNNLHENQKLQILPEFHLKFNSKKLILSYIEENNFCKISSCKRFNIDKIQIINQDYFDIYNYTLKTFKNIMIDSDRGINFEIKNNNQNKFKLDYILNITKENNIYIENVKKTYIKEIELINNKEITSSFKQDSHKSIENNIDIYFEKTNHIIASKNVEVDLNNIEITILSEKELIKLKTKNFNNVKIKTESVKMFYKNLTILVKENGFHDLKNYFISQMVMQNIPIVEDCSEKIKKKLISDSISQVSNLDHRRKIKKQNVENNKKPVVQASENLIVEKSMPKFLQEKNNSTVFFENLYFNSVYQNPIDNQNIELVKGMVEIGKTDMEEDQNKMIQETSQFLIELNSEYQKDIEITKSTFKEFDELDSMAEFSEVVEMYKMDLENELEAIKNDFEMRKENGLKNIKKKFAKHNNNSNKLFTLYDK